MYCAIKKINTVSVAYLFKVVVCATEFDFFNGFYIIFFCAVFRAELRIDLFIGMPPVLMQHLALGGSFFVDVWIRFQGFLSAF